MLDLLIASGDRLLEVAHLGSPPDLVVFEPRVRNRPGPFAAPQQISQR